MTPHSTVTSIEARHESRRDPSTEGLRAGVPGIVATGFSIERALLILERRPNQAPAATTRGTAVMLRRPRLMP
jgi:hypothetical protein